MASRRQMILEVILARLEAIEISAGFQTNAGQNLYFNQSPALGPDDHTQAISLVIDEDIVGFQGEQVAVTLPVEVQALTGADIEEPWKSIEAVIADIKKAMELPDRTLGGLTAGRMVRGSTKTIAREEGMTAVGASVTYLVPMVERWGEP